MSEPPSIIPIVEGHGEQEAVPTLIRRIGLSLSPPIYPNVLPPIRRSRPKLVRQDELERTVKLAANKVGTNGRILIIIDADDDCPATLGPQLLARAQSARPDRQISVVLAKSEFESWFLAGASGLAGQRGLSSTLNPPDDPESKRDAKGWLTANMTNQTYKETTHQAAFADCFDMHQALQLGTPHFSDSFHKFWRECHALLGTPSSSGLQT